MDEWYGSQCLPATQRDSFFESVLIDIMLINDDINTVNSLQDCRNFVESFLKDKFEFTDAAKIGGALQRLSNRLWICYSTGKDDKNVKISDIVKGFKKSLKLQTPLFDFYHKEKKTYIILTIPDIDLNNDDNAKAISYLIALGAYTHGADVEDFTLFREKSLDKGNLHFSIAQKRLCDNLVASAKSPLGTYTGERITFTPHITANVVEMLSMMRLLNSKSEFVRKNKSNKYDSLSFFMLSEKMSLTAGFKGDQANTYISKVMRAILLSSVQHRNTGFPGGWIHSIRASNKVKHDVALLLNMGWVPKTPSPFMVSTVLFNTVDPAPKAKEYALVNITQDKRNFSFQEFRTAVALTLPKLDTTVKESKLLDEQINSQPLEAKSLRVNWLYTSSKRDLLVDSLVRAFIFKVSEKDPKSKTKLVHYKQARDRMLNLSANIPLVDAEHRPFKTFSDLPEHIQKMLREKFRYPLKRGNDDVEMQIDQQTGTATVETTAADNNKGAKRRRLMTKGQAHESLRRSGRLAKGRGK